MIKRMTQVETIAAIRAMGLTCSITGGEYRINTPGSKADTAHFTTDREDALSTAKVMARDLAALPPAGIPVPLGVDSKDWAAAYHAAAGRLLALQDGETDALVRSFLGDAAAKALLASGAHQASRPVAAQPMTVAASPTIYAPDAVLAILDGQVDQVMEDLEEGDLPLPGYRAGDAHVARCGGRETWLAVKGQPIRNLPAEAKLRIRAAVTDAMRSWPNAHLGDNTPHEDMRRAFQFIRQWAGHLEDIGLAANELSANAARHEDM